MLLPITSIILTARSIAAGGVLSFWTYSLPEALLLPVPYKGWTVFIGATILWCVSLICAVSEFIGKRSTLSTSAFVFAVSAPVLVLALATAIFWIGLRGQPFA